MNNELKLNPKEYEDFFESVGTIAAATKIFNNGFEYVNNAEYWRWLTTNVVKEPIVNNIKTQLNSATNIQNWIISRLTEGKEKYIRHLLETRGAEFDFVTNMQNDPIELLKGFFWRMATPQEDRLHGIDAIRRNIFTGIEETHQIKAGLSESFKRVNLSQYIKDPNENALEYLHKNFKQNTPVDVVDVNENIANWRNSSRGVEKIVSRGDIHSNVRESFSDKDIANKAQNRFEQAKSGNAIPSVTFQSAFQEIGKGAITGAVIFVGISTITNYKAYRNGQITGNEFANNLVKDSAKGGLMGGSMAAINIPIQLAAKAIGVGMPVTIPVMIIVGYGLKKIIDPIFGEGDYREILNEMNYTTDITNGLTTFAISSYKSFEMQKQFVNEIFKEEYKAKILNEISKKTDKMLKEKIEEI